MTIKSLVKRCSEAVGPDRALDVDIVFALYPDIGAYQPQCVGDEPIFWNEPYRKRPCPPFTASIDAAASLIGELAFTVGKNVHHGHWIALVNVLDGDGCPISISAASANTGPLALCAAALIARTTQ